MRIAVVDDNELWRSSLVAALSSCGFDVSVEVSDGDQLLEKIDKLEHPIQVAILDLRLPPTWSDEGINLGRTIRQADSSVGVIVLSGYEQDVQLHYASRTLKMLDGSGGVGYLFKDRTSRRTLFDSVTRVADGKLVVDSLFAREAASQYTPTETEPSLTAREAEVLELVAQGLSNSEIAAKLLISQVVVERHITRIFRQILPAGVTSDDGNPHPGRKENRRVLAVLEWLRRTGRLS